MLQSWQSREIEIDRDVIFNFYPKVHLFYKSFKLKLVFVCCVTIHVCTCTTSNWYTNKLQDYQNKDIY
jgi:hypothetical protein